MPNNNSGGSTIMNIYIDPPKAYDMLPFQKHDDGYITSVLQVFIARKFGNSPAETYIILSSAYFTAGNCVNVTPPIKRYYIFSFTHTGRMSLLLVDFHNLQHHGQPT